MRNRNCQKHSCCSFGSKQPDPCVYHRTPAKILFSTLTFPDMSDSKFFLQLYTDVLYNDVVNHCMEDLDISSKLTNLTGVYTQGFGPIKVIDYNGVSNRCAYLHKYAPAYTAIVCSTMRRILVEETTLKFRLASGAFRMCSLGGGPGTDVVGIVAALDAAVGSAYKWQTAVSVVDYMQGWRSTFKSVVCELRRSKLSRRFSDAHFSWKYVQGDLLDFKKHEIWDSVTYSSLVTIVKCLSTFRYSDVQRAIRVILTARSLHKDTEKVNPPENRQIFHSSDVQSTISRIFRAMSFGSFILIVDDDLEELTELIMRTAESQHLVPIFGPLRNVAYLFEDLKVTRFGHTSCHQATVTTLLLMKPLFNPKSPFAPELSPATKHCSKCGDTLFQCRKCSVAKDVRNFLMLLRVFPHSNSLPRSNESRTSMNSQIVAPVQNESTLSDSVVIELPE